MWAKHVKQGCGHPFYSGKLLEGINEDGSVDATQTPMDNDLLRYVTGQWDNTLPFPHPVPIFSTETALKTASKLHRTLWPWGVIQPIFKCATVNAAVKIFYRLKSISFRCTYSKSDRDENDSIFMVAEQVGSILQIGWRGKYFQEAGTDRILSEEPPTAWSEKSFGSKLAPRPVHKVTMYGKHMRYSTTAYTNYSSGNIPAPGNPSVLTMPLVSVCGVVKVDNPEAYYILGAPYIIGDGLGYANRYGYFCALSWMDLTYISGVTKTLYTEVAVEKDVTAIVAANEVIDKYDNPAGQVIYQQFLSPVIKLSYFSPAEITYP